MINIEHLQKFIEASARCSHFTCDECWREYENKEVYNFSCWKLSYDAEMLKLSEKLRKLLPELSHNDPQNMISDEEFFELLKE